MKKIATAALALALFAGSAWANDEWPEDLAGIERLVQATVGDISYRQVEVRQKGRVVEVSIGLDDIPSQFRTARLDRQADESQVFLATNFVQLEQGGAIAEFSLMPINAHLVDYYFGFFVFNFGKGVKLPVEIVVIGNDSEKTELKYRKKKFKVKKKALTLRAVKGQVSAPGFYALQTVLGDSSLSTYFCNSSC